MSGAPTQFRGTHPKLVTLPFEAKIALRYLRGRKTVGISLTSVLAVLGVSVGVAALIVVTSVWNGFESEFLKKLLSINAHAVLLKNHDLFRNHEMIREKLLKQPGISNVTPFIYSEVIAQSGRGVQGVALKGIDPLLAKTTPLRTYVGEATLNMMASRTSSRAYALRRQKSKPGILIGHALAKALKSEEGDPITLISPYGGPEGSARTQSFEVLGVFHSGMQEFDARMVFIDLYTAQRFFRLYRAVTALDVWSVDPFRSKDIVQKAALGIGEKDPYAFEVRDWSYTNHGLFSAVRQQKGLISLVLFIIVLVASFNIMATLILLILEKEREIAVLKSLGASNRSVLSIFFLDGQLVGLIGCTIGLMLGLLLCAVLEEYGLKLDPRVYYLEHLPIVIRPLEVAVILLFSFVPTTLATLLPAFKAASLQPVEGLTRRRLGRAHSARNVG